MLVLSLFARLLAAEQARAVKRGDKVNGDKVNKDAAG
jgi:hypothetical protein